MDLWHWIFGKHPPRPADPERSTAVALLPRWQAELAVAELNAASIDAVLSDEYTSYLTTTGNDTRAHIYVMEPDATAARAAIAAIVARPPPNTLLRPADRDDEAVLDAVLPSALHVAADDVADQAQARYVAGFGDRTGDVGWIAETVDGDPVGAAWVRHFGDDPSGFGYVDGQTPEMVLAVEPGHRRQGHGSDLLIALGDTVGRCSTSIDRHNPAVEFLQRFGFVIVDTRGDVLILLRDIDG